MNRGWRFCRPLPYHLATAPMSKNNTATQETSTKNWSGKRDSNPRLRPWQGRTLPLSYSRSNNTLHRSIALPPSIKPTIVFMLTLWKNFLEREISSVACGSKSYDISTKPLISASISFPQDYLQERCHGHQAPYGYGQQ